MPPILSRVVGCALSLLVVLAGVNVAFPQTPNQVDIEIYYDAAWHNINQYVLHRDMEPIVITRGRQNEGQRCDPGQMTLTLNNRDGRFSPRNPNGPLFGKIGRNTPIRTSVTYNAITYVRFVGEIPSWPSRWDVSGRDVWVPVEAAGIMRRLGQGEKPIKPSLDLAILADGPVHYWRVDDPDGSTKATSSLPNGTVDMSPIGTIGWAQMASPPGGDGTGSAAVMNAGDLLANVNVSAPWTVEWSIFRPDDDSLSGDVIFQIFYLVDGVQTYTSSTVLHDTDVSERDWYHYKVEGVQNGGNYEISYWRNGIAKGIAATAAGTLGELQYVVAGGGGAVVASDFAIGYIALYGGSGVIDAQEHSDALQGYEGEQAHQRFERLCTQAGIPFATVGSSSARMSAQRPVTLLQSLRDCEDTDQGFQFERRDALGLKFRCNSSRYNQIPLALSYTGGHISPPFDPEPDDLSVANDREVKSRAGATARQELTAGPLSTQDPPNGIGRYDDTIEIDPFSADQLPHIAAWRLHIGTWDAERYPRVKVDLAVPGNSTIVAQIAAADSGDLITIANLPAWLPPETAELLVEGYKEAIGFFAWDFVFNTSPAGPYNVVGAWGLMAQELQAAINSSATSADIATTSGPLLATAAAHIGSSGYTAKIGGEEIQVTAVAASTVTFGTTGTAAHANNANVTPGIPASVATGDLLLCLAAIRSSGAGVPSTPAGYTRLPVFNATDNVQLFAKIATSGAEAAPTVSFTGGAAGDDTSAQMIRLAGKWHSASFALLASAARLNAAGQNITYPGLPLPAADNCIVIYIGWKQDDWTSVATIASATEIGEPSTTTGNDQGMVWDYVIQTTAAAIASGVFTVTGGTSQISRGAVLALRCDYQSATITRSVNGVSASHSAADAVTLARPARWAL